MREKLSTEEGLSLRSSYLTKAKRIVVKVGSAVLTGPAGLNARTMAGLAEDIAALNRSGREIILVSSGAFITIS